MLAAAAFAGVPLFRIVRTEHGLPLWDEAAQGFAGLEAARALGHVRPLEFLAVLRRRARMPDPRSICTSPSGGLAGILSMPAVSLVAR